VAAPDPGIRGQEEEEEEEEEEASGSWEGCVPTPPNIVSLAGKEVETKKWQRESQKRVCNPIFRGEA